MCTFKKISILRVIGGIIVGVLLLAMVRCSIIVSENSPTPPAGQWKITDKPYFARDNFMDAFLTADNPCTVVENPYTIPGQGLAILIVERRDGVRVATVVNADNTFQVGQKVKLVYYRMLGPGVDDVDFPTVKVKY